MRLMALAVLALLGGVAGFAQAEEDLFALFAAEMKQSKDEAVKMPEGIGRIKSDKPVQSDPLKTSEAKPTERVVEKKVVVEKPVEVEKIVEIRVPVTNTVEKVVEKKIVVEKPIEKIVEKKVIVEKPIEKIVEKPVEKIVEKKVVVEKPVEVEKIVEKRIVVERTNVVEKIILDKSRERELLERERQLIERQKELQADKDRLMAENRKLSGEKEDLKKKADFADGENQGLTDANAALNAQLAKEHDRCQRLERVIPKENRQFSDNFLKITAPSTFYDRKEGYAVFRGGVHVHDNHYELYSQRAFVFNDPVSNVVSRIVALENVVVTNGTQRAYGTKASYYRQTGMVVLYGDAKTPAIVRDESRVDDQEIVGEKIKFWLNSQQVEVLKARIKAPVDAGGMTGDLTRRP